MFKNHKENIGAREKDLKTKVKKNTNAPMNY